MQSIKLPEDSIGRNLCNSGLGKTLFGESPKPQIIKEKVINWASSELKISNLKGILKIKIKSQTEGKYLQYDKEFVYKIYKELSIIR